MSERPEWKEEITKRLTNLKLDPGREAEIVDELSQHLEEHYQESLAGGASEGDARRMALEELSEVKSPRREKPLAVATTDTRQNLLAQGLRRVEREMKPRSVVWGGGSRKNLLADLWQDVCYGLRQLRRNPGFTTVAVVTLALGIGANTAIFTLTDAVILRTLPVHGPGQLVLLKWGAHLWPNTNRSYSWPGCPGMGRAAALAIPGGCSFSYPVFEQLRRVRAGFSGFFAFTGSEPFDTTFQGTVSSGRGQFVSGSFFPVLGQRPAVGSLLEPIDDVTGAAPALVLGYGYWQSRFGGDPSVVGKTVQVNGSPFTIAGVSAKGFMGLEMGIPVDFWMPLSCQPSVFPYFPKKSDAAGIWLDVGGRLKPNAELPRAQAAVSLIFARAATSGPGAILKPGDAPHVEMPSLNRGLATLRQQFSEPLSVLMAAVGIILLIVCANLAGLMLARATTRQREIAVRLAMGAGRGRIIRQLFTESALVAAAGGGLGILFAYWGASSLASFLSTNVYTGLEIDTRPDFQVLGFTLAISALAAVLFGFAPVVLGSRVDLVSGLKEGGGDAPGSIGVGKRRAHFGSGLVVAQVALSVLVLAGAGLLVRTLVNLETMNVGFDKRNLLIFDVDTTLSGVKGPQLQVLSRNLQDRFTSLPGVTSVSYSMTSLLSGSDVTTVVFLPGAQGERSASVDELPVGPHFFHTMRISVLAGRTFAPVDFDPKAKPEPVVVNQMLAHRYFGNDNPLGRSFGESAKTPDWQIVGVVADAKYSALREPIEPTVYRPLRTSPFGPAFELRTARNPKALISLVRSATEKVNKNLLLANIATQTEQIDKTLYQERLIARLSAAFGFLALVLSGIGLYGLLAYQTERRTHEIGIRMALGAQKRDVLSLVVTGGMSLTMIGVCIGIAGALGLARFLSSLLYGVKPTDPFTFVAVSLVLISVALLACYIPARRAAKVDLMMALRYE